MQVETGSSSAPKTRPRFPNSASDPERTTRLIDMTASLVEIFGANALSVARSQPGAFDVGGDSGIRWEELAASLHHAMDVARR